MVMAADSSGRPWDLEEPLAYRPDLVDWTKLTRPGTTVELVKGQPAGSPMPAFTPTADTLSQAGTIILTAADPVTLLGDSYRILDGLEAELRDAAAVPA
jgi:hypothetical protein